VREVWAAAGFGLRTVPPSTWSAIWRPMSRNSLTCSGLSASNTYRRTAATWPGAAFSTTAMPASVRVASM
jgi:hypothetical protein